MENLTDNLRGGHVWISTRTNIQQQSQGTWGCQVKNVKKEKKKHSLERTRDHNTPHCHWTAIATKPIRQCVPVQMRGILHGPEEQSRPRGGKSICVTDQPQYPRL
jgi:hypothetical protein